MLAGVVPFDGENRMDIMMNAVLSVPTPPSRRVPVGVKVPPALERLALRAMSKQAAARPTSAAEFRSILLTALGTGDEEPKRGTPADIGRLDRASRVAAVALGVPTPRARPVKLSHVLVLEPDPQGLHSLTALTRALVARAEHAESAAEASPEGVDVVVASVPSERPAREVLRELVSWAGDADVLAVGPSDMVTMTAALELGVADYVPHSQVAAALQKKLARVLKRRARRK
jgi:hypothetical protein